MKNCSDQTTHLNCKEVCFLNQKMSLFKADDYSKYNHPQRCGAFKHLVANYDLISSLPYPAKVLDVGCGTGENTKLLTYFSNVSNVVGFDRDSDMIPFADCVNGDPKITYAVGDIEDFSTWPKPNENVYNLAVSFFVLHWIRDQAKALNSVHRSLMTGGYFLARIAVLNQTNDVRMHHFVNTSKKWSRYKRGPGSFIPKQIFTDVDDPAEIYEKLLTSAKFSVITCKNTTDTIIMNKESASEYLKMSRLHRFSVKSEEFDDFAKDCFFSFFGSTDKESYPLTFHVIDVLARKI